MADQPLAIGVVGAAGRMGTQACSAISQADGLRLAATVTSADPLGRLVDGDVRVAVDLTRPDVVMDNIAFYLDNGMHAVIGTSGIDADKQRRIAERLGDDPSLGVVVVPNFAVGAVLAMRFARQAARFFDGVEVIELHHAGKADAPSGTAAATAASIAAARQRAGAGEMPDATAHDPLGARGGAVDGVRVHSVRLPGLVAHQEVLLGSPGDLLTIRHDSTDRASFMPGLLLAARTAPHRPGLTVGLEPLLDLDT